MTKKKSQSGTEYYVAFSIHGTNCFITANITIDEAAETDSTIRIGDIPFEKGHNRTASKRGATKLLASELSPSGRPEKDPKKIHAFFQRLRAAGWTVDDADFEDLHKIKPVEPKGMNTEPLPEVTAKPANTKPAVDPLAEKMAAAANVFADLYSKPPTSSLPLIPPLPPVGSVDDGTREGSEAELELQKLHDKENVAHNSEDAKPLTSVNGSVKIRQGDIALMEADAIVNAANAALVPGGGVDGALNRAAGPELEAAMREVGGCATGGAHATPAFLLPAKYVIHAVGPIYTDYTPENAAHLLRTAYLSAFETARIHECRTVVAPLLSTGVYGYPMREACEIALKAAYYFNRGLSPEQALDITFVAFDSAAFAVLSEVYHNG